MHYSLIDLHVDKLTRILFTDVIFKIRRHKLVNIFRFLSKHISIANSINVKFWFCHVQIGKHHHEVLCINFYVFYKKMYHVLAFIRRVDRSESV